MRLSFLVATAILSTVLLAAPASTKDKKPEDPDKRICRSEVPTGSRMSKSVLLPPKDLTGPRWFAR